MRGHPVSLRPVAGSRGVERRTPHPPAILPRIDVPDIELKFEFGGDKGGANEIDERELERGTLRPRLDVLPGLSGFGY